MFVGVYGIKYDYLENEDVYTLLNQGNGDYNFFVAGVYSSFKKQNITIAFNHFKYSDQIDYNESITLKLNDVQS